MTTVTPNQEAELAIHAALYPILFAIGTEVDADGNIVPRVPVSFRCSSANPPFTPTGRVARTEPRAS